MIEIAAAARDTEALRSLLERSLRSNVCAEECVMCGTELRRGFFAERGIIAVSDVRPPLRHIELGSGVRAVLLSDSRRARRALRDCGDAVCCGTSPQDTLTVSSVTAGRMLVAVQRSITALDGSVIEPCETAVKTDCGDIFGVLLAAAVLLLCGCPPADGLVVP